MVIAKTSMKHITNEQQRHREKCSGSTISEHKTFDDSKITGRVAAETISTTP